MDSHISIADIFTWVDAGIRQCKTDFPSPLTWKLTEGHSEIIKTETLAGCWFIGFDDLRHVCEANPNCSVLMEEVEVVAHFGHCLNGILHERLSLAHLAS